MSQKIFKITSKQYRYSVRFRHIIFPFTSSELLSALARTSSGYTLAPPPRVNIPVGTSIDASGIIAKKGNSIINFDSVLQVLAVEGQDPVEIITVFSEIIDIIKTVLVPELEKNTVFYELIANHTVEIGQSSMKVLGKQRLEGTFNEFVSKTLGEEVSNYSIHISSSPTGKIDDPNWFDMQIQPFNRRPDVAFDVMTVYRKSERSMVDKFGKTLEENLRKIFEFLSVSNT